jgi:hypothetical protein
LNWATTDFSTSFLEQMGRIHLRMSMTDQVYIKN